MTNNKKLLEQQQPVAGDKVQQVQPVQQPAQQAQKQAAQPAAGAVPSVSAPKQNAQYSGDTASLVSLPGVSDKTKQALGGLVSNGYQPSQNVSAAMAELNNIISQQPAAFQSGYQQQLQNVLNTILGRESFSYDMASDPMYQMYRQQYAQAGKQAMQDTMGQAATLTGGYGSSYAQTAGQQAYNQRLQRLNDVVPQLYQQARQAYQDEGDALAQQYGMLGDAYSREYGEYQDALGQWRDNRDYAAGRYDTERAYDQDNYSQQLDYWANMAAMEQDQANADRTYDYGKQQDALAQQNWEKQFAYGQEQDALSQQNWQTQFDYGKEQDALSQQNWEKQLQMQQDAAAQDQANLDRDYSYDLAMAMLDAGRMPSDSLLKAAGLSDEDIRTLKGGGSSGSSSSSGKSSSSGSKGGGGNKNSTAPVTAKDYTDAQSAYAHTETEAEMLKNMTPEERIAYLKAKYKDANGKSIVSTNIYPQTSVFGMSRK